MFQLEKRLLATTLVVLLVGPVTAQYGPNGSLSAVLPGSTTGGFSTPSNTRRSVGGPYNGFYAVSPPMPGFGGVSAVAGPPMASRQFNRTLTAGSLTGYGGVVVASPFAPLGGGFLPGFNGMAPIRSNVNVAVGGSAVFFGAPSVNPTVLVNPVFSNSVSAQPSLSPFGLGSVGSAVGNGYFARVNAATSSARIVARSATNGGTQFDRVFAGLKAAVPRGPANPPATAVAVVP